MARDIFKNKGPYATLAVAAGKGGVGKSTVSTYLAYALLGRGLKVGLLDADIYGPSQGHMLGLKDKPYLGDDDKIIPPEAKGLKAISMSMMVDPNAALIWRGPMVQKAVDQFVHGVNWGDIDILILDLPPGTGDIQLSLMQQATLTAALLVTTPQDIARIDVMRAKVMFERLNVPVLGVVENMSQFVCSNCGHETHIFGQGQIDLGVPLLGQLPLHPLIQEGCECAKIPEVLADSHLNDSFQALAESVETCLRLVLEKK